MEEKTSQRPLGEKLCHVPGHLQYGVFAAHRQVVDHDVVVRPSAQRRLVLGDLDFLDDDPIQRYDQLAHLVTPCVCSDVVDAACGRLPADR